MMTLPKGRDLARLYLLGAASSLHRGGRLYLAGANRAGIKTVLRDAELLCGMGELLAYRASHRVACFRNIGMRDDPLPEIYRAPGLVDGTYERFETVVGEKTYTVLSRPGVFSRRHLDAGTRLLLDSLDVRANDLALDVGCGYGIIGMHAARCAHSGRAVLVDSNSLAVECAKATLAVNGIKSAEVLLGNGIGSVVDRRFSLVVSNPPFHAGHSVDLGTAQRFIRESYGVLEGGGRLVLVANRFLPYQSVMQQVFGGVTRLRETRQYHVLAAEKDVTNAIR